MFNFADTGGLFDDFEVNREPFWPKLTWLVAGSGVWHIVLVALILSIPPLRDAFSITAMFRDAGFVDKPYVHTDIEDAAILDFSNQKFHYPEGYWAMDQEGLPPLPNYPVAPFTPAHYSATPIPNASPSPSVTPASSPTPAPLIAGNNRGVKNSEAKPSPGASPQDKSVDQAQKELEAASKKTGIELPEEGEINKAPFKALAMYATDLRGAGKLDFNKSFEISIETTLDDKGKLVNPKVTKAVGDEVLVDLVVGDVDRVVVVEERLERRRVAGLHLLGEVEPEAEQEHERDRDPDASRPGREPDHPALEAIVAPAEEPRLVVSREVLRRLDVGEDDRVQRHDAHDDRDDPEAREDGDLLDERDGGHRDE